MTNIFIVFCILFVVIPGLLLIYHIFLKILLDAGFIRKNADAVICFYDGKSKGTSNMIYNAKKRNLLLRIVHF